jgi:membrane fusion protein, multidrug efflux system
VAKLKKIFSIFKNKWFIIGIIVGAIGLFFYFSSQKSAQTENGSYKVVRQDLKEIVALSGKVDAEEHVTLQFQTSGKVVWVGVKEGDYVEKYQGIASLDQRQVQKQIEKYLNNYMTTRWDYEQSKEDNQRQMTEGVTRELRDKAKRLIEQDQFALNNSVLDVELQTLAKEAAYLYSPIEGIVVKANPEQAGINSSLTDTKYEIVNPNTLYFSVTADQTEVVKFQEGMQAEISIDAYPDEHVTAFVESISYTPKTDETGTVYEMKMSLDGADLDKYRLGMTGDAEFTLQEIPDVLVVPSRYIETEGNKKYVYKMVDGKLQKTQVTIGADIEGDIEVKTGVKEGDVLYEKPKK